MADTIITNTPDRQQDSGAVGLILALIIVAAIVVGGFVWYRKGAPGVPNTGGTNINVTLPSGSGSTGGGSAGGGASGGTGGTGATQ